VPTHTQASSYHCCPSKRLHHSARAQKKEMAQEENETREVGKEDNQRPAGKRQEQFD
jgi:hypothetical protein